jgi:hypothetical protein
MHRTPKNITILAVLGLASATLFAAEPAVPAKPLSRIVPGQVIVPTDAMRRIWGELVSLDFETRTGKFRKESTDEVLDFTVLPYAELLHHAAFGDLQDFRIGVRAIFRVHEAADGRWTWLTYIQDQMNMMNGHKEYFHVDGVDAEHGQLNVTQANVDKSFVREKGILLSTDSETQYWKQARPATFADIKVGDQIRTETHGIGKGKVQMCWNVFLDDLSLLKFQDEQKSLEAKRLAEEGAPGYVDAVNGSVVELTLFWEGSEISRALAPGKKLRVAPAGVNRRHIGVPVEGKVTAAKMQGNLGKVSVALESGAERFETAQIARLWIQP